ncbi:hypothetical protein [Bdellovibrio sp. HCB-162]|uniref:hypothetical protein n=1 Tax=Bdellovibrio sp. HCB-162 TaxID=3394234 RepID=UPI0039BCFDFF
MKVLLALLTSLMFLTACELQQDPIKGASDQVRQGVPPTSNKPVAAKPLPKEALQIDAPTLVNGRVGAPVEFKILGRVMTPDVGFKISIDNLADFPGATFDDTTGDFKWTPSKKEVGSFPSMELPLRVTLATEVSAASPTISVEKKVISLIIQNAYSKPIVNTVTGPTSVTVGSTYDFDFTMEDVDALNETDASIQVRDCTTSYYSDSIAHLVEVRNVAANTTTPNKYQGKVRLDLTKAGLLSSGTYCFGLQAVSKHGVVSDLYKREITIEAKMKNTRMTMETAPEVRVGEKIQIGFAIYDPTGNGQLTMKSQDDIATILPGSSLTCNRSFSTKYQLDCKGLIDATSATVKVYEVNFVVENAGSNSVQKVTTNHTLRINVKAAVTP